MTKPSRSKIASSRDGALVASKAEQATTFLDRKLKPLSPEQLCRLEKTLRLVQSEHLDLTFCLNSVDDQRIYVEKMLRMIRSASIWSNLPDDLRISIENFLQK